jgi:serine/threonine protein kinase
VTDHAGGEDAGGVPVGTLIGERYRILGPLGRGGMGAVYRVEHIHMKKDLALKLLHPELSCVEEVARRFEREAEAAARLQHPNIITVTDFGRTDDRQSFLVMELLSGASLAETLRTVGGALGVERSLGIVRQILKALEHAHTAGVVHRDLKPENIMLISRDGEADIVKLLDFGIAKMTSGRPAGETLTQAGVVFGTPEYLSPEQAMGETADGRADLYAVGVILYEMLTGRRPFEAESKVAVVSMHLTQKAMPITKAAPLAHLPQDLERVVERAMEKKREARYPSATAFLAALDDRQRPRSAKDQALAVIDRARRLAESGAGALVERARTRGVRWPRAFVGVLLGVVASLLLVLVVGRRSSQRPAAPERRAVSERTSQARSIPQNAQSSTTPARSSDPLAERLRTGRSCKERKAVALELIGTGDARYLDAFRAARDRRGGLFGIQRVNGCMIRELDAAIRRMEAEK